MACFVPLCKICAFQGKDQSSILVTILVLSETSGACVVKRKLLDVLVLQHFFLFNKKSTKGQRNKQTKQRNKKKQKIIKILKKSLFNWAAWFKKLIHHMILVKGNSKPCAIFPPLS